jgi:ribosome-associated protein
VSSDGDDNPRALKRRQRRAAGDRSARLANALMTIGAAMLPKLELDEDLRAAIDKARAVTAHGARRRAERELAGELRRVADLAELSQRLANVEETGAAEPRLFQRAEEWRARLIADGIAAAKEFPGGAADPLPHLVQQAQRERDTGKPPGAARALFRHVVAMLRAARPARPDPVE